MVSTRRNIKSTKRMDITSTSSGLLAPGSGDPQQAVRFTFLLARRGQSRDRGQEIDGEGFSRFRFLGSGEGATAFCCYSCILQQGTRGEPTQGSSREALFFNLLCRDVGWIPSKRAACVLLLPVAMSTCLM